jgi:hypothetical protein
VLQVPPWLQLPFSLIEWGVVSYDYHLIEQGLGLGAPSWQQQLLEALLVVAVPWVPLLLQHATGPSHPVHQHTQQAGGQQQQGAAISQPAASSSGPGLCKQAPAEFDASKPSTTQDPGSVEQRCTGFSYADAASAAAAAAGFAGHTGAGSNIGQPCSESSGKEGAGSASKATGPPRQGSKSSSRSIHPDPVGPSLQPPATSARQAGDPGAVAPPSSTPAASQVLQWLVPGLYLPAATQPEVASACERRLRQPVGWRLCSWELLYVALLVHAVLWVVRQRVQGPVCALWAAAQPTIGTHSGSKGAVYSLLAKCKELPAWSQQVLCGPLWSADVGSKIPGLSTLSWAAGEMMVGAQGESGGRELSIRGGACSLQ